jgi:hypothetical protein
VGCHKIEDNAAVLHQYYIIEEGNRERFDDVNAPPALWGEGAKAQPAWVHGYLQDVQTLRPWLKVRMPSYEWAEGEPKALAAYFANSVLQESQQLSRELKPIREYMVEARGGIAMSEKGNPTEGSGLRAGADWIFEESLRKPLQYLRGFALEHRLANRFDLNPNESERKDLMATYQQVVRKSEFFRELFDVQYPFTEAAMPAMGERRFELGKEFLLELKCLQCHVMGDPNADGAHPNPTAPNLSLTDERLQREWSREWLVDPTTIQPGTKMPTLWPGMVSAFAEYGENRAALEAKYGKTAAQQIDLMVDFMYEAGARGVTVVQPEAWAAEEGVEKEEGEK